LKIHEVSTNTLMKGLEKREVAIMDVLAEGSGVKIGHSPPPPPPKMTAKNVLFFTIGLVPIF
jgi:hypothetical protein